MRLPRAIQELRGYKAETSDQSTVGYQQTSWSSTPAMKITTVLAFLLPFVLSSKLALACQNHEDCDRPCDGFVCEGPWCYPEAGQTQGRCHFVCAPHGTWCPVRRSFLVNLWHGLRACSLPVMRWASPMAGCIVFVIYTYHTRAMK